jgi:hypothetical protein
MNLDCDRRRCHSYHDLPKLFRQNEKKMFFSQMKKKSLNDFATEANSNLASHRATLNWPLIRDNESNPKQEFCIIAFLSTFTLKIAFLSGKFGLTIFSCKIFLKFTNYSLKLILIMTLNEVYPISTIHNHCNLLPLYNNIFCYLK